MIQVCDVSVVAASTDGQSRPLLTGVTLELTEQRVAFIGANGSGKSTLLRLMNGLVQPTRGVVRVAGLDTVAEPARVRELVGFTFTDPLHQLLMPTPVDDVELSLRRRLPDRGTRRARAMEWLTSYGLDHVADQSVYDLSGGERQLAALVSVLAVEPSVLVCDEPTTLLDLRNARLVVAALERLSIPVVMATHDLGLAAAAERVVMVDGGRIVADGAPDDVIRHYRTVMA